MRKRTPSIQLIVWRSPRAKPVKGWQARVGAAGPGETAYFAAKKYGYREARRLAEQALRRLKRQRGRTS